jgi:hypothetical protein
MSDCHASLKGSRIAILEMQRPNAGQQYRDQLLKLRSLLSNVANREDQERGFMKTLFVLLTLVIGLTASATTQIPAGYKRVDDDKMEDYKQAINMALTQNPSVITGCDGGWVSQVMTTVEDILLNDQSGQPLLIFNSYRNLNAELMDRLIFTTDASLKKVIQVDAEVYKLTEVNQGDLSNPDFVQDYVLQTKMNCVHKH